MNKFYVYIHKKVDDGNVFYVGKGAWRRRAFDRNSRSEWWKRTVEKHGLIVEILEYFEHENDAFSMERWLIEAYRNSGYLLVNMTDGGDGVSGLVMSEESKNKMRLRKVGCVPHNKGVPMSEEMKKRISETKLKNPTKHWIGKSRSESCKEKIRTSLSGKMIGELNPFFGKKHSEATKEKMRAAKQRGK